jgi:hypothetical protein
MSDFVFTNRKMIVHGSALLFFTIFSDFSQEFAEIRKFLKIHNSTIHGQIQIGFEVFEPKHEAAKSGDANSDERRIRKPVLKAQSALILLIMDQFRTGLMFCEQSYKLSMMPVRGRKPLVVWGQHLKLLDFASIIWH